MNGSGAGCSVTAGGPGTFILLDYHKYADFFEIFLV